jgi:H+/Cl- antiporter ClcA
MLKIDLQGVRLYLKRHFDKAKNEKLKRNILQAIPFWVASVITGLVAVAYTKLFLLAENLTTYVFNIHGWLLFILTPVCFVFAWWLVKKFSPYARGSGIPQVVAAIEISDPKNESKVNQLLSFRVVIVKALSSLVMAIGGGAIGREGPTIQMAASIYKIVNDALPAWWPRVAKANIIITGAAAGLAAAFNTPLGGIVFAIEELTKTHFSYFKTAIFSSVIIAGLTVEAFLGPYLYLGYPKIDSLSNFIFVDVILIAVISGLAGAAMSKLILVLIAWRVHLKRNVHRLLFVVGCALLMAAIANLFDPVVLGSGKDVIEKTLFTADKYSLWYTPVLRIIGPVLSFTTGAGGGIFAPALGAGAGLGSLLSGMLHLNDTDTHILILAGMVGFLSGVTRTPFTSAILVLEMTNRHNVIFHLILAGMMSSLAALLVDKHSLYEHLKVRYIRDLNTEEIKHPAETFISGVADLIHHTPE